MIRRLLRKSFYATVALLSIGCSIHIASAQTFPSKSVRFIVCFAPGGSTDTVARLFAAALSERWAQQVVVDNRPGGGTIISTEITARAPPDGHTFLIVDPSFAINPGLYKKLPYDPVRDFAPVTLLASLPLMLVVHPSVPAKSVQELIALARAKPGFLSYASAGIGGSSHMAPEIFKHLAHIDIVHIPYKGGGPAVIDLVAGQVSIAFQGIPAVLHHVRAGKLRALAVSSAKRSAIVPDVPTIAEGAGMPGYDVISWQGIFTPAGVPAAIIAKLQSDMASIAHTADIKSKLAALGAEPVGSTPAQFSAYLTSQMETYANVIRTAGIRPE